ncbi:hypothetical protein OROHE_018305 [Orobanche hederae]
MVVLWWKEDGGGQQGNGAQQHQKPPTISVEAARHDEMLCSRDDERDMFSRANRVEPDSTAATNVKGKREHGSGRSSLWTLLCGTTYCISSCSMILLNKIVLSSYACDAGISLMLYHNLISCVLVALLSLFGAVTLEKLNWKLIRLWLSVNIIFVAMLVSGMYSVRIYTPKNLFQELEMAKGTFRLHAKCRTRGRYFYQRLWICMQMCIYGHIVAIGSYCDGQKCNGGQMV